MSEDREFVFIRFMFIDEWGQKSELEKSLTASTYSEDCYPVEAILLEFKNFLVATGFSNEEVNRIKYVDNRE